MKTHPGYGLKKLDLFPINYMKAKNFGITFKKPFPTNATERFSVKNEGVSRYEAYHRTQPFT